MGPGPAILLIILACLIGIPVAVVVLLKVIVPVFQGLGWILRQAGRFIIGEVGDALRIVGGIITSIVLVPMVVVTVVVGRWSASAHYGRAIQAELKTIAACLYRIAVGHPARLLCLTAVTEGLEKRIPQVMAAAPGADKPPRRVGQFEGYRIIGSLPGGGSGGKLYVAEPDPVKHATFVRAGFPSIQQVVIKAFSLDDGSSLPQIVRESRALDAAKKMGLVLDHELTNERFYYVMEYVPGDSLGLVTQRLHAVSGAQGLTDQSLRTALGYLGDLLATLDTYHVGGLWHKDVKPDNIIVDGSRAHLVDLGLVSHLRSAMTLTTHGTEYFRDPEMVRMALKGVKVHQVDGAKFDIYAAGAVLYSIVENSFPAHGGLSQISKRCPETVRWIVRRAMTDYDKRYASAAEMLGDLRTVLAAADPFTLRPADLPSVRGSEGGSDGFRILTPKRYSTGFRRHATDGIRGRVVARLEAAGPSGLSAEELLACWPGDGTLPKVRDCMMILAGDDYGYQIECSRDDSGDRYRLIHNGGDASQPEPVVIRAAASPVPPPRPEIPTPPPIGAARGARARPNIRVTDWFTGRYAIADAVRETPCAPEPHAVQAASVVPPPIRPVHARVPVGGRVSAQEQVARARARARQARRRAHERMRSRAAHPRIGNHASGINSGVAIALFLFLGACVALIAGVFFVAGAYRSRQYASVAPIPPETPEIPGEATYASHAPSPEDLVDQAALPQSPAWAVALVLSDITRPMAPEVESEIFAALARLQHAGVAIAGPFADGEVADLSIEDQIEAESLARAARAQIPLDSSEAASALANWLSTQDAVDLVIWITRDADQSNLAPHFYVYGSASETPTPTNAARVIEVLDARD